MKIKELVNRKNIWLLGTIVLGSVILYNVVRNISYTIAISGEVKALRREAQIYRDRIEADNAILEQLNYDDYIEKYARENHHMQRESEDIYIIKELKSPKKRKKEL